MVGCSVSVGDSASISKPEDAAPGTCLTLSGTNAQDMKATKVACDGSTELSFYSAGTVAKTATCTTPDYSSMTFPGSDSKLCMALNLTEGSCYQINPSNIVDYRRIDCGTSAKGQATAYKVTSRTDGTANCAEGQLAVDFTQPKTIGYCLQKA